MSDTKPALGDTTRRRDFKEDDATVPVALGIWVYSAVARCFAWTRVVPWFV